MSFLGLGCYILWFALPAHPLALSFAHTDKASCYYVSCLMEAHKKGN